LLGLISLRQWKLFALILEAELVFALFGHLYSHGSVTDPSAFRFVGL